MAQLPQLTGAALLLVAYILSQTGRLRNDRPPYLLMNFAGALLLTVDAVRAMQWGFILLEGTWALVTVPALWRAWRGRPGAGAA
ncbi:MAG: hypothetical protein IT228_15475 [Flavobacteriales bacterium]|nr:hypothetical protein [Flavobacteriales bacterium]MCC6578740.1 hypothetical protein [Flavobacteriales bacterium]NUQ13805.1 hypothetical protein [Flavobacteriales bacterium]